MAGRVQANAKELRSFDQRKFTPQNLQAGEIKAVLAYSKVGQFIPAHTPNVDVILCILEGEAEILAGDEKLVATENDVVVVPRGLRRGVKALAALSVLHIIQPPPSEEDHSADYSRSPIWALARPAGVKTYSCTSNLNNAASVQSGRAQRVRDFVTRIGSSPKTDCHS